MEYDKVNELVKNKDYKKLCKVFKPLIFKYSTLFLRYGSLYDFDDLMQEGYILLYDSINKFDFSRSCAFSLFFKNSLKRRFIRLIYGRKKIEYNYIDNYEILKCNKDNNFEEIRNLNFGIEKNILKLSKNEKIFYEFYFLNKMKIKDIIKEMNVSKQYINFLKRRVISKIKFYLS